VAGYARSVAEASLQQLEGDPSYQSMDPRGQRNARASLLQYIYRSDPQYAGDAEANVAYQEALNRAPVVDGKLFQTKAFDPNDEVIKQGGKFLSGVDPLDFASKVLGGLGDERSRPEAIREAKNYLLSQKSQENNFILELANKGYDFLADLFGDKREYYKSAYGKGAATASLLLEDALRQYDPAAADEAIASGATVGAVNRFLAEAGVSVGSVQGGIGVAAAKGMSTFLGKKGASAATMSLLGRVTEEVGEGLGFGAYNVVRDLTRERIGSGESLGTKWDERLGKIAAAFGSGVAIDAAVGLVMGLGKGGLSLAKGIYRKQPTGMESLASAVTGADDIEVAREAIRAGLQATDLSPGIYQSLPEGEYKAQVAAISDLAQTLDRVKEIDPTSFEGAKVIAFASGFNLTPEGDKFRMTSLLDPKVTKEFPSEHKALKWAGNLWKQSDPASQQAVNVAQGAARAASLENTLSIETQGYLRPEDLGPQEAVKLLVPTSTGALDARNVAAYARWWLKGAGASEPDIAAFKVLQGSKGELADNGLVVPKLVGTADGEVAYLGTVKDSLEKYAEKLGLKGSDPTRSEALLKLLEKPDLDTLRPRTLQYVAKEYLGGELTIGAKGINISFADGRNLSYPSLQAANGAIFKNLVASGSIPMPEVSRLLKETYGYNLVEEASRVGGIPGTQYGVLTDSGKLLAKGPSLPELFEARPDLVPKLPNRFAPELLFVDDTLTTIQTSRKAAAGSTKLLRDMIKDFRAGWKPGKRISSDVGGSLYLSASGKQVFVLESPFGTRTKYLDSRAASKALKANALNWETLQNEASRRGMRAFPVPEKDGGFLLTDGKDNVFRARTLDEAADFLKKQARPEDFADALGTPDPLMDELEDGFLDNIRKGGGYKALEKGSTWYENGILYAKGKNGITSTPKGDFLLTQAGELVFPAETTFVSYAKKTGNSAILGAYRLVENARNITDIANRKVQEIARAALSDSRGRLLPGKDLGFVSELLSLPEDRWASFAKETGRTLDTKVFRAATLAREAYDVLGKRFGIDSSRWLREYVPKLQAVMQGGKFEPTLMGLKQASRELFGKVPHEVEFFSMNFRNGLVLDALMGEKNAYNLLMAYGVQGNKSLYIGPVWEKLWDASEALKKAGAEGAVPPGLQNRWESYLEDVAGIRPVGFDRLYSQLSLGLTEKISKIEEALLKGASKVPVAGRIAQDVLESGKTRAGITSDILGKLSNQLTFNTQGFRPFVALRNTLDIQRAGAVLGNSLVFDSLEEVLKEPEYIGKLLREGVIEDTLFTVTAAEDIAQSRWRDYALRGLLGSDLVTRAATAKAVDKAFDTGIKRLGAGQWNWEQFFRKTGLDTLAPDLKQTIADSVSAGNLAGARFIAQKGMVDMTMFTFRSGTGNLLTRHVMGKVFGKFQNYSFGMIDLYRRILSTGSFGDRALKMSKLVGNSLAVYYAAQAIGIDYNGFLPSDSIGVSGGPYWRAAYAALNVGREGYAGRQAKQELLRTFYITAYPEPVARALTEGLELASQGRDRDAFLRLVLGAPVKKDF
jgi:hypothetical protein